MCAPRSARRRRVLNSGAEPHEPGNPKHDKVHRGTHLPFTSRDRRGDDPQCAAAIVVPRAGGLRHHGKKANSLVSRKSGSVLVILFHLCVRSRRADRNLRSLVQGLRPLKASNGKVKRSRSPIQAWQVDVSRTSANHLSCSFDFVDGHIVLLDYVLMMTSTIFFCAGTETENL